MEGTLNAQAVGEALDRVKIISMLYDGAADFASIAKKKMELGDAIGRSQYINKTSAIIRELENSLNMDGGELSQNLKRLYEYVLRGLIKAETQNDIRAIEDAEKIIEVLRSAWQEMQTASKY